MGVKELEAERVELVDKLDRLARAPLCGWQSARANNLESMRVEEELEKVENRIQQEKNNGREE